MKHSIFRAVVRSTLFATWTGILLAPYLALMAVAPDRRHHVARWYFKGCLVLTGLKLRVHGNPKQGVALYTANHATYLDIPVLGAVVSHGLFVAKSEVGSWPLFGFLARLAQTQFVSRSAANSLTQRNALAWHINAGASMILFPEGTSTNGSHVRPFKSTLFSALEYAQDEHYVQPITIVYTRQRDGAPLTQDKREHFTWFGDMTLAPHLWGVFGRKGCEVDVVFHAPVNAQAFADRKPLAKHCEDTVRNALNTALSYGPSSIITKANKPAFAPSGCCSSTLL